MDNEQFEKFLKEGERVDDLERNNLVIIQNPKKFCFGMDAVLLSYFAAESIGETAKSIIDLGTGNGILPLLLSAKTVASNITGIEIQEEMADMASRSVSMNGLSERVHIFCQDLKSSAEILGNSSFDCVVSNPPYMTGGHGLTNPDSAKAIARHEIKCTFDDVCKTASALLVPKGHCFFVHRPFRLVDIFSSMRKYSLEPKRMRLVYPTIDSEPNMVLIEGIKGAGVELKNEKPLIVYESEGVYIREIKEIYAF